MNVNIRRWGSLEAIMQSPTNEQALKKIVLAKKNCIGIGYPDRTLIKKKKQHWNFELLKDN